MSRVYRACRYRADGTQFHYETETEFGGGSASGYLFTTGSLRMGPSGFFLAPYTIGMNDFLEFLHAERWKTIVVSSGHYFLSTGSH